MTLDRDWKRLFPIRFRHLRDKQFKRWQWIDYRWRKPKDDQRPESQRVEEDSIVPGAEIPLSERAGFLNPLVVESLKEPIEKGHTLTLLRPASPKFYWKKKAVGDVDAERRAYKEAAKQLSLLDRELNALEPCPYEFRFQFNTPDQSHDMACADWETAATYWKWERAYGQQQALSRMSAEFGQRYPQQGMVLALGTHSRFPSTWLLVGVIRLQEPKQPTFL